MNKLLNISDSCEVDEFVFHLESDKDNFDVQETIHGELSKEYVIKTKARMEGYI